MQELEKILEEIDRKIAKVGSIPISEDEFAADGEEIYDNGKTQGRYEELIWCRNFIRKHMNDGWIPVEDRLPINHEGAVEVTVRAGYREVGYYDQYREEWWTLDEDGILDVVAWKEPSEPYRPERRI